MRQHVRADLRRHRHVAQERCRYDSAWYLTAAALTYNSLLPLLLDQKSYKHDLCTAGT